MVRTLETTLVDPIYALMRDGLALAKQGRHQDGVPLFKKAWELLPEPKYEWDISQITLYRMAKFFRDAQLFGEAHAWIDQVAKCPGQLGDGKAELIKGTIYFAAGEMDSAFEWLDKAYQASGKRVFQGEDPKYLNFLKTRRKL
jgi:tetratricopeptide (TPR) repeat protein